MTCSKSSINIVYAKPLGICECQKKNGKCPPYYITVVEVFFILCCIGEKVKSCLCSINFVFKAFAIKLESLKIALIVRTYGSLQFIVLVKYSHLFL